MAKSCDHEIVRALEKSSKWSWALKLYCKGPLISSRVDLVLVSCCEVLVARAHNVVLNVTMSLLVQL